MRGSVLFIIVSAAVLSLISIAAIANSLNANPSKEQAKNLEFSTFTSAVCENSENFVHCKDEVFVKCNDKTSRLKDFSECNGMEIDIPQAVGFAVFDKEWKCTRM